MSMRSYGYSDYGLIVTEDEAREIAKKISPEASDFNILEMADILESIGMVYVSNFTGDAIAACGMGVDESIRHYDYETIYYIPVLCYPTLCFGGGYKNADEVVEEFKSRFGEYLGEDFPYKYRISHILGVYEG